MQLDNRSFQSPYSTSSALCIAKQVWRTALAEQLLPRHQFVPFPTDLAYAHQLTFLQNETSVVLPCRINM